MAGAECAAHFNVCTPTLLCCYTHLCSGPVHSGPDRDMAGASGPRCRAPQPALLIGRHCITECVYSVLVQYSGSVYDTVLLNVYIARRYDVQYSGFVYMTGGVAVHYVIVVHYMLLWLKSLWRTNHKSPWLRRSSTAVWTRGAGCEVGQRGVAPVNLTQIVGAQVGHLKPID